MADQWFYSHDGRQVGPVSFDALRQMAASGSLAPQDYVWTEGMSDWAPARSVPSLFPSIPPPGPEPVVLDYGAPFIAYAGFWRRFVAALIDAPVLLAGTCIIGVLVGLVGAVGGAFSIGPARSNDLVGNLLGIIVGWLYSAGLESSSWQGTVGKMAMGIKVTDLDGMRVSFARATGRHFAKMISLVLLLIGYIMAGFTARKQALHDIIAGCLVVRK